MQIDYLSYSAVSSFFSCPRAFHKNYVLRERSDKDRYAFHLGKAFHLGVELILLENKDYEKEVMDFINTNKPNLDPEELEKKDVPKDETRLLENLTRYKEWFETYKPYEALDTSMNPAAENPKAVEIVMYAQPFEDLFQLKGIADVVTDEYVPVDHKYVAAYSTSIEKYYPQAWFLYHLIHATFGVYPPRAEFHEFKKTPNRDKTFQLRVQTVEFTPHLVEKMNKWYADVCGAIEETSHFPANPFGMFGADEFKEYLSEN